MCPKNICDGLSYSCAAHEGNFRVFVESCVRCWGWSRGNVVCHGALHILALLKGQGASGRLIKAWQHCMQTYVCHT